MVFSGWLWARLYHRRRTQFCQSIVDYFGVRVNALSCTKIKQGVNKMKVLIWTLLLTTLICLTAKTTAKPVLLKQLPPIKAVHKLSVALDLHQIHALLQKLELRKQLFEPLAGDYEQLFELLVDEELVYQGVELFYLSHLSIDLRKMAGNFDTVGFTQQSRQHFVVNYNKSLHLVLPKKMFYISQAEQGFFVEQGLLERGFRQSDLAVLREYAQQFDPSVEITRNNLQYVKVNLPKFKRLVNNDDLINFFTSYVYINRYHSEQAWLNWGLGLLQRFDLQRQRILKSYLLERLAIKANIYATPVKESKIGLQQFVDDTRSGKFEQRMNEHLTTKDF